MPISKETLDEIALSETEYRRIVEELDREPTPVELGMFGALWSEHCGYKHSRALLSLFPSRSPRVLLPPGEENAGAIDIGDGLAIVFKIESHNHPSAVEPFQGAATGVGGIVRDILAMGARPIALMNSLRFGPLDDPRNRYLFDGVVSGISWYGNCIGVPDVGGEIYFSPTYANNPLVNALCVGLIEKERLVRSAVGDEGNLLLLAGADTGRDGIHGASGLASRTFEDDREMRPTVQVGNPFLEKTLIEACLEASASGHLRGLQDLGAAGLTSAAVESASRSGAGIDLDVSNVPRREQHMNAYEVMLSESQERMLLVVAPADERPIRDMFGKWDIPCTSIGRVTGSAEARIYDGPELVAQPPIEVLTKAPRYRLEGKASEEQLAAQGYPMGSIPLPAESPGDILARLVSAPNIASREPVYRRYDHQVQTNTVVAPGGDAAVLRIRGTAKGITLSTDGNGRLCYLDPYRGGAIAVAEACRNLSCTGATPIALTDCLNFGNPEEPDIYFQLEQCIRGIARGCRAMGVPVVSGNVSLYNSTQDQPIYPTPVIGALGLLEDVTKHVSSGFDSDGLQVVLLGSAEVRGKSRDLSGSEYLELIRGMVVGRPMLDLKLESKVQELCRRGIGEGLVRSAHDCSDGGLAVALAEACFSHDIGFEGQFPVLGRWDAALFGERQSRIIVSVSPGHLDSLGALAGEIGVPWTLLGRTQSKGELSVQGYFDVAVDSLKEAWQSGLEAVPSQS